MNTEMFTRATTATGKAMKKHKGNIATSSLIAMLVSSGMHLTDKWMDSRSKQQDTQTAEDRILQQLDRYKTEQAAKDRAQWEAISRKQDNYNYEPAKNH